MKNAAIRARRFWSRSPGIRQAVVLAGAIIIAVIVSWNLAADAVIREMNQENFRMIAAMFGKVKEAYPDFREEEWLGAGDDAGAGASSEPRDGLLLGKELLGRYGIFGLQDMSSRQSALRSRLIGVGSGLLAGACAAFLAGAAFYLYRRQKRIDRLTSYIREVDQGRYQLELEKNREDELSALQNELYKITVMLRESAELAGKQRRALSDSVSDLSHQLKTPLASVTVLLDNLSESPRMSETTRRKFLAEMTRQLAHVNWLIAALLKLSRLDAGVVEFEQEEVDLDGLLEDASGSLRLQAELKQVRLEREGQPGIRIEGDRRWITEAVENLIKNALEHSAPDSRVVIRTQDNPLYASVSVRDWGEGIPDEDQKHIFERFYRSPSAGEGSTGIGLSLAKEIIERQNGYLTVSSDPEKGTEFLVRFMKGQGSQNITDK